jgi:hypothetical protein
VACGGCGSGLAGASQIGVWQILEDAGIGPADDRTSTTWSTLLRSQASALLACDVFETFTLNGARRTCSRSSKHSSRRIRILGATAHPTAPLGHPNREEPRHGPRRYGQLRAVSDPRPRRKVPALFDAILAAAGIQVVLGGVRIPRMNAIMERWIQSCRHELLDRTLIWNQQHLLHALREYGQFYNSHRPHQGIANARLIHGLPPPIIDQPEIIQLIIHRRQRLDGILNEYHHAT